MKTAILTICVWLGATALVKPQAMVRPATDGREAAAKWLALVDADAYGACWALASKAFQSSVSKPRWVIGMNRARRFYGKVLARKFKNAVYSANPPEFAPGEYELLRYQVDLALQGPATEVVLMVMEGPGQWQVAGYTIVLKNEVWIQPLDFLNDR